MIKEDKLNEWKYHIKLFLNEYYGKIDYKKQLTLLKELDFSKLINQSQFACIQVPNENTKIDYLEASCKNKGKPDLDSIYLARLIYCIVCGDYENNDYALPDLTDVHKSFGQNGKYGCETINNYTHWSNNKIEKPLFDNNEQKIIDIFMNKFYTIGNFMPLQKKINNEYWNCQKGLLYNDLPDKFYIDKLNKVAIGDCFTKDFCKKNFLEPYFDITNNKYQAREVFRHSLREYDNLNKDFLFDFAAKSIAIIDYRAERICAILKDRLKP